MALNSMGSIHWTRLLRNQVLVTIMAMLVVVPVLFSASIMDRAQQLNAYGVLGLVLLVVLLFRVSAQVSWREAGRIAMSGPNLPILLYLGWNFVSASRSVDPFLSRLQIIQLCCGVVLYAAVALQVRRREEFGAVLGCMAAVAVGAIVVAVAMGREREGMGLKGTFHDQQLFGAFLLLLFPVVLGLGVGARHPAARIAARAVAVLMTGGLLLSNCRSSCIGAVLALLVFAALSVYFVLSPRGVRERKHELVVIPIAALVLLGLFVTMSGSWNGIQNRFGTLLHAQQDDSFQSRQELWKVAERVIQARPVTGWGPGAYAIAQVPFNPKSRTIGEIQISGPSLSESPHNSYLNLAAEQGLVGLGLYGLVLLSFLYYGVRALPRIQSPLRQYVLIGCMSAVCGEVLDGVGNPGWMYPEVAMFFWLVLGLGVCAAGLAGLQEDDPAPERPSRRRRSHRRVAADAAE